MTINQIIQRPGLNINGIGHIPGLGEREDAVRAVWADLFSSSPDGRFDAEEILATGDRCVVRWIYSFKEGHVRGVDIMRLRDGKVTEKFSYVKG